MSKDNLSSLSITRTEDDWFAIELPVPFLEKTLDIFLRECPLAETYLQKKKLRDDDGRFHVTVITPAELMDLARAGCPPKNYGQLKFKMSIKGIGCVCTPETEVYFAVINSPDILSFRASYGLSHVFYPHCTLGFSICDIHGVPKNKILWKL